MNAPNQLQASYPLLNHHSPYCSVGEILSNLFGPLPILEAQPASEATSSIPSSTAASAATNTPSTLHPPPAKKSPTHSKIQKTASRKLSESVKYRQALHGIVSWWSKQTKDASAGILGKSKSSINLSSSNYSQTPQSHYHMLL